MKRSFIVTLLFCSGAFLAQEFTLADLIRFSASDAKTFGDHVSAKGYESQPPIEYRGSERSEYLYNTESDTEAYYIERDFSQDYGELSIIWRMTNQKYYSNIKNSIKRHGFKLEESKEDKDSTYSLYTKDNIYLELEAYMLQNGAKQNVPVYEISVFKTF